MRLLLVEDDKRAARYLVRGLTESGHVVDHVGDGETGLTLAREGIYDVLVVDRRLPDLDGISLVRRLRESDPRTPVLMLSAIATTPDRIAGLEARSSPLRRIRRPRREKRLPLSAQLG